MRILGIETSCDETSAAVVDETGVLVGLVCRKRSGEGYCTDAGIRSKRAERPHAG